MDIQSLVAQLRDEVETIESAIAALVGLGQTAPVVAVHLRRVSL
jgi:hypothetical protein